jgi:hypothetical protein
LERKGKIKLKHVPNARRQTVQAEVRRHVEAGSQVFTDALPSRLNSTPHPGPRRKNVLSPNDPHPAAPS